MITTFHWEKWTSEILTMVNWLTVDLSNRSHVDRQTKAQKPKSRMWPLLKWSRWFKAGFIFNHNGVFRCFCWIFFCWNRSKQLQHRLHFKHTGLELWFCWHNWNKQKSLLFLIDFGFYLCIFIIAFVSLNN